MKPIRILSAGHDHGGVNLLRALLSGWAHDRGIAAEFLCPPVLRRDIGQQFPELTFAPSAADLTEQMCHRRSELDRFLVAVLAAGRYDAVICGTSANALLERRLLLAARQAGIPSVAFCDMWWAYADRFHDGETWTLPDRLWVIDETMRREAAQVEWPRPLPIDVIGSPLFGELARLRRQNPAQGRAIRFISEPASIKFPEMRIDEFELAEMLVSTARASDVDLPIVIRPHPVDSQESWRRFVHARRALDVRLDDMPLEAAIPDTARAVGLSSMLLMEMRLRGVTVASMQPRGVDLNYYCLPFEELDIVRIGSRATLVEWLRGEPVCGPVKTQALHLGASDRAASLLTEMVRQGEAIRPVHADGIQ
jgi:hypothetical protein